MPAEHIPVLVDEVVSGLRPRNGGVYIDGTLGGGGHAAALLDAAGAGALLLGVDADPKSLAYARETLERFHEAVTFAEGNFRYLANIADDAGFKLADGILLDLGISSAQLDATGRGFSFADAESLDMRFSTRQQVTAWDYVNTCPESALADLIYQYGEEPDSRRIARAIVAHRPIDTAVQLAQVVAGAVRKRSKIHPATKTFQALRIAVNEELDALRDVLPQALRLLVKGGVLAVISFHSLEDRIVKEYLVRESKACICPPTEPICVCGHVPQVRLITRHPLVATPEEIARNPRSRSAKLRLAEKL